MSEPFTIEAWKKECAEGATEELLHLNMIYVDGNPYGWTEEIICVLRNEIARRAASGT